MAGQQEAREVEEHYILRVKDQQLAKQIRAVLRGESEPGPDGTQAVIKFEGK